MMKRKCLRAKALAALLVACLMAVPAPRPVATAAAPAYRALLIGNNAYQRSPLKGCINDAMAMRSALLLSTGVHYVRVELATDLSAAGIAAALDAARGWGQTDDDVTVVYYSGHGFSNSGGAGIVGTDMVTVPFSAVESRLAKIRGTVGVMIDACYSGALIGKSLGSAAASPARYNAQAVAAFRQGARGKALTGYKYHVITACNMFQQCFESGGYGFFTTGIAEAMGWNATAGKPFGAMAGDADRDKFLTVGEAYAHAERTVRALRPDGSQSVRVSPEDSALRIAGRADGGASQGGTLPGVSGLPNLARAVMAPGWSYQLTCQGAYTWTSSDDMVAGASASGLVTAFREGRATLTGVRPGQQTITLQVVVAPLQSVVQGVRLSHSSGSRAVGKGFRLKAAVSPDSAKSRSLRWFSTDGAVASVAQDGQVTPRKPGSCTIYAIGSSGAAAGCALTVVPQAVVKVVQKRGSASVGVGRVLQLSARALPTTASNRRLKWTSTDERIAVIGEDSGIVRGLRKGRVYVVAAAMDGSGAKARCLVTVK